MDRQEQPAESGNLKPLALFDDRELWQAIYDLRVTSQHDLKRIEKLEETVVNLITICEQQEQRLQRFERT